MSDEIERLRAAQSRSVMPKIGGLLDAWDGLPNDLRGQLDEECPMLSHYMETISVAMDESGSPFPRADYEHTANLLRSSNERIVKAVLSNNLNIILAALDLAAKR